MSHDFWIEIPHPDGKEPVSLVADRNHTRNTSRMWHWSIQQASDGKVQAIQDTAGWPVPEAYPLFLEAFRVMAANGDKLRGWNPPNGWGSYESALAFLFDITGDSATYRDVAGAVVQWSV